MTQQGAVDLYQYLGAAWPLVVKPGVDEKWATAKKRELYQTYREYSDEEVMAAFQKWTAENDKYPTTKQILTEIKWARARKNTKHTDPTARYNMEIITDDGTEYMVVWNGKASFTLEEFMNIPRNKEHLDPEEWERRYKIRRKQILYGKSVQ